MGVGRRQDASVASGAVTSADDASLYESGASIKERQLTLEGVMKNMERERDKQAAEILEMERARE